MIRLGCFGNTVDDGAGFRTGDRIDHQPVLLSYTERPNDLLGSIVVDRYLTIFQEISEIRFLFQAVIKSAASLGP